jgi:hypothetical protein
MTAITATGSTIPLPLTIQSAASPAPINDATATVSVDSVTISTSSGTLSASAHPSDTTAEQRVDSLVNDVRTHNDIADAGAHIAWAAYAKVIGQDKGDTLKVQLKQSLAYSTAYISREFGESGINVTPVTDKQAAQTGVAAGSILLGNFSFKEGNSTYTVTAGEDGTLTGTRDGQAWKTWRTTPTHIVQANPDAETAVSTLQDLLSSAKPSGENGSTGLLHIQA